MSFLQLASFNGSVKRDKNQEAMLQTINTREQFLQRLDEERRNRTKGQMRNDAAVNIQKHWRRHRARREMRKRARELFDGFGKAETADRLERQISRLSLCYEHPIDDGRLVMLCGETLTIARTSPESISIGTRMMVLRCVLRFLLKVGPDCNVAVPLRTMSILTLPQHVYVLVKEGYFRAILKIISYFTPETCGSVVVEDSLPPKLDTLCEHLMIPIQKAHNSQRSDLLSSLLLECGRTNYRSSTIRIVLPYTGRLLTNGKLSMTDFVTSTQSIVSVCQQSTKNEWNAMTYVVVSFLRTINCDSLSSSVCISILNVVSSFLQHITFDGKSSRKNTDAMETDQTEDEKLIQFMHFSTLSILSLPQWISTYIRCANDESSNSESIPSVVLIVSKINSPSALELLVNNCSFVNHLWNVIVTQGTKSIFGASTTFVSLLCAGEPLNLSARSIIVPCLSLFSSLLSMNIRSIDDAEFNETNPRMLFNIEKLTEVARVLRDITLGLIVLAFPDSPLGVRQKEEKNKKNEMDHWAQLYEDMVMVVRTLQQKDQRVRFLPDEFWSSHNRQVVIHRNAFRGQVQPGRSRSGRSRLSILPSEPPRPFAFVQHLVNGNRDEAGTSSDEDDESSVQLSSTDLRNLSIMKAIPFVVSFKERNRMFEELLRQDRESYGIDSWLWGGHQGHSIAISVRRQNLYDDAFEALSVGNVPNLRYPLRVHMINWAGLDEAGVDGGGISREFLSELIKTAFDPAKGFFQFTNDRLLYPNPLSAQLYPGSYSQHFFFLGRIIAKLIYEKQLAEMRFAEFFLSQLLGAERAKNVDLHHMKSYDPIVWRQLVKLRDMDERELDELDIDFSVMVEELGSVRTVDLIWNGSNIRVTRENRQQYVQLYVNYFLYKRMEPIVDSMRAGVADVLDVNILAIFSPTELQFLVSGADVEIDINDLRRHCAVHNVKDASDNQYVEEFWATVHDLSATEKRALLKFITGCSRPPLDGFKDLNPPMGIQLVHSSDHLPTSATCMNLLKLPVYRSTDVMTEKIRYAINAGAGFELS